MRHLDASAVIGRSGVTAADVDAHLLHNLFRRVRPLVIANVVTSLFLVAMLWGRTGEVWLVIWGASLIGWTMMRFLLARVYLGRDRPPSDTRKWVLMFATGSGVNGLLWGLSVHFFAGYDMESGQLAMIFVMGALSIAALTGYSNNLVAFFAFLLPALLPYGVSLIFASGAFDPWIAGFFALWVLLAWLMASGLNEGFKDAVALNLRNDALVDNLSTALGKAEAANEAKARFLANLSHEFRTPLNAVIGYSEIMRDQLLGPIGNPNYETYARDIHVGGMELLKFVDDILSLAELETGEVDLTGDRVDMAAMIPEIAALEREINEASGVAFTLGIPDDLPPLLGDREKLALIVQHLVSNAFKFTPAGGTVSAAAQIRAGGQFEFIVTDTGIGMEAETIKQAMVPFAHLLQRDDKARERVVHEDRGQTRNGLGLPLVKLLAELHGGRLEIDSTPGKGTTVRVVLPASRVVPDGESAAA